MSLAVQKIGTLTTRANILTTELNALASAAISALGSALANGSNRDRFAIAELLVTFGSSPTDRAVLDLFMLGALDGTNYGDATQGQGPAYVASFEVDSTTSAQRLVSAPFELLGCNLKFQLLNRTNVALPASGTIVNLYTFNHELDY